MSTVASRSYSPGTVLAASAPHSVGNSYLYKAQLCQACHAQKFVLRRCLESLLDSEISTDTPAVKAPVGTAATTSVALLDLESMQVRALDSISALSCGGQGI
jgi:hypothetical protein